MPPLRTRFSWLGVGLLLAGALGAASAAEVRFEDLAVGFDGDYRVGCWTPVRVTLSGADVPLTGHVEIIVNDGDDVPSLVRGRDLQLVAGQPTTATLFVRFGRVEGALTAHFVSEGKIVARETWGGGLDDGDDEKLPIALDANERLFLQIGPSLGVEPVLRANEPGAAEGQGSVVAEIKDTSTLPTRWYGYEGVETVLLTTSQPEAIRALTTAQLEALDQWVRLGGRLVLCAGTQAPEFVVASGPLARFVPGAIADPAVPIATLTAFEKYAESNTPIAETVGQQEELAAHPLAVPRVAVAQGRIEAEELDLPLVIRAPHGFGQIVFVAADLDRDPFRRWKGLPALITKLLDLEAPTAAGLESRPGGGSSNEGYGDLAGQLRSSLDQFRGIRLVPFSIVALLIIGYILLIGPGDYFFLKKVLGRMELTWITFPTIVLVTSLAAYALGRYFKGDQLRVNQADVVDFDQQSRLVRGTSYMNVFSPSMHDYDFAFRPQAPEVEAAQVSPLVSWLGLPGDGLGGMANSSAAANLWARPYRFSLDLNEMLEVPIVVMGTRSLTARWEAQAEPPARAELRVGAAGTVVGWLENRSDEKLENAFLCYGRWAYDFGALEPGERRDLAELGEKRRDLATFLSGERSERLHRDTTTYTGRNAYDPSNQDVERVLRQMMFFDAAGGERYAGLRFRYQTFLDASPLLAAGQAVLVARPAESRSRWLDGSAELVGPEDDRVTYFRVVFPVTTD